MKTNKKELDITVALNSKATVAAMLANNGEQTKQVSATARLPGFYLFKFFNSIYNLTQ
jgi:hypothetical protein